MLLHSLRSATFNLWHFLNLQARNKKIDADIIKIENSDILGMVHEFGLSPDALYELILAAKKNPLPVSNPINETEEDNSEN